MVCTIHNQPAIPLSLTSHLTEAKKFDAVHRKMVKANNNNPIALLHFPKSISAMLLTLAVSPARNEGAARRSDMIVRVGGIRMRSR